MRGSKRVSRTKTIPSDDRTATLRLIPPLRIVNCTKAVDLTVVADFSKSAVIGSEHRLVISGPDDIGSTIDVEGDFPEDEGASARPIGPSTGIVTIEALSVRKLPSFGTYQEIARIRLTGDDEEDIRLVSVVFTNNGKARLRDLQNLRLENGKREVVTDVLPSLDHDRANFTFLSNVIVERNATFLLTFRADVRASRRQTIDFSVEEQSDLVTESVGRR